MILPYESGNIRLTSPFGERVLGGISEFHGGIDLVGISSKQIIAVEDGVIGVSTKINNTSDRTSEWGNYIRLDTESGLRIYYCHLSQRLVNIGQRVKAGDHIGIEGSTGKSTGSHLHFEIRDKNGAKLNAAKILEIENAVGIINQPDFAAAVAAKCGLGNGFIDHVNKCPYADAAWRKIYNQLFKGGD